ASGKRRLQWSTNDRDARHGCGVAGGKRTRVPATKHRNASTRYRKLWSIEADALLGPAARRTALRENRRLARAEAVAGDVDAGLCSQPRGRDHRSRLQRRKNKVEVSPARGYN